MAFSLPTLVAHADWGSAPAKRWLALARLDPLGRYLVEAPQPAGSPAGLLKRLRLSSGTAGPILAGFDFPIGIPAKYAERAGVTSFLELLPRLGQDDWADFYRVAESPHEIHLRRPFYPLRPGAARRAHLLDGLGMAQPGELLRLCDRAHAGRRAACPLFWTLGGQQVGKAAIHGWRDVLGPGLQANSLDVAVWPFDGRLADLLHRNGLVMVETYPAECYAHLGIVFSHRQAGQKSGKRVQGERAANAARLLEWTNTAQVRLAHPLHEAILDGFGPSPDGEDPFDTLIGLFGMLNILLGRRNFFEPEDDKIRQVEGWIFGQAEYNPSTVLA